MTKQKRDNCVVLLLAILLSYFTYFFVMHLLPDPLTDYNGHVYIYLPMFTKETWFRGWMTVPYCMWHLTVLSFNRVLKIPIEVSAAYTTCLYSLFAYFVLYWMIQKVTAAAGSPETPAKAGVTAFGLCFVQPLFFHWLDAGDRFLGAFSMNPLHNPTQMCARGFSLVCLCLVWDIFGAQRDKNYRGIFFRVENGLKKYYLYLAAALFLSAMAKPTFAEMFIPATALVMLGNWISKIIRKDSGAGDYFRHCLASFLCAVPTLIYILFQFLAYFIWGGSYGGDGSIVITGWLEVWHMYTENVGLSVLLGMAFPLMTVLLNAGFFFKNDCGRLALTGYLVGFLEAALLGEGGVKLSHADFLWPMMFGMQLMWVTAMMRLLVLERTQADAGGRRLLLQGAWFLFFIHVCYGLIYVTNNLALPLP